ncbi:ATPase, partial [Myroides odoratimimus]|nr:ATPase [Myroides odoratimimus]
MNILEDFKSFYLSIVLPNLPGFAPYFNESNFDVTISELIEVFETSFSINPFDITNPDEIKKLLKNKPESFVTYSDKNGSGVPNAILNTHYFNFLKYRNEIRFNDLQDFNNKLNEAFGSFTKTFQKERIKFNGNIKVASNYVIFGDVRDDYW